MTMAMPEQGKDALIEGEDQAGVEERMQLLEEGAEKQSPELGENTRL